MYKLPVLECCGQFCTFCHERGLPCQCPSAASQWAQHLSSKSPVQEEAEQDLHIPWLPVSCSEGAVAHGVRPGAGDKKDLGASSCRPSRYWTSVLRQRTQTLRMVYPIPELAAENPFIVSETTGVSRLLHLTFI